MIAATSYPRAATQAAFELGGIGTGNVSIGTRGELRDWELANRPGMGNSLPYSFFAIRVARQGAAPIAKVLEGRFAPPYPGGGGFMPLGVAGLPRFEDSQLSARYPFVTVDLFDGQVGLPVQLEAFTPFIPHDAKRSGLPMAVIRFHVDNPTGQDIEVSVAGSLGSPIGVVGADQFGTPIYVGQPTNSAIESEHLTGVGFGSDLPPTHREYGTAVLASTAHEGVTYTPQWRAGYWPDGAEIFWVDFKDDGRLEAEHPRSNMAESRLAAHDLGATGLRPGVRVGSVAATRTIKAGGRATFEFILAWHFPNRLRGWEGHVIRDDPYSGQTVLNYYAVHFADALAVAEYATAGLGELERESRAFSEALHSSNLPPAVIESLIAGIATLRSTTCFRIADGTFLGWEGSLERAGSCEGTCTHVWNYAQTVAFLFPELEVSARSVEFLVETDSEGSMAFRTNQVF
ncbi:MAG: hypothetical protein LBJ08_10415, partial [Bifidobacteriaceae bacterium]|nr:hypothetical protein [Bifidobacteriaceae bacterium]